MLGQYLVLDIDPHFVSTCGHMSTCRSFVRIRLFSFVSWLSVNDYWLKR